MFKNDFLYMPYIDYLKLFIVMFYTINGKKNSKQMTNTVNLCILVVFITMISVLY